MDAADKAKKKFETAAKKNLKNSVFSEQDIYSVANLQQGG